MLLLIVPISFANDNSTYDDSSLSFNGDEDILSSNIIYFNSSADYDGNGSQSNPYKYFSSYKVQDNSILYFADGQYTLNRDLSFSNLTIIGNDPLKTIINGHGLKITSSKTLYISNVTLNGPTIKNDHDLTVNNVIFQNCKGISGDSYGSLFGGAIKITGSGTTLINASVFRNNGATYGGAIYSSGNNGLIIINSTFENNHANKYGGAIAIEDNVYFIMIDSTFGDCYSVENAGGAIYSKKSTLEVIDCNFTSCNATFGGAICDLGSDSIIYSIIANNNKASYEGGAIYKMYGTIKIDSSSFLSNEAPNGGAIFIDNSSLLSINSSSFSDNVAEYCGGAIYTILNTNESLNSVIFKDNIAQTGNNYYEAENYNLFFGNGNYTMLKGNFEFNSTLPSRYDLRDYGWVTPPKHQKNSGNCWVFTQLSVLQSCIFKATNQTYIFSEENMKNMMAYYSDYGWELETNNGGYDDMGVAYLVNWIGVIPEDFESYSQYSVLSPVFNSSFHVQNLIYLTRSNYTDNDAIKEAIIRYGAVATGIYYSGSFLNKYSYYYPGTTGPNHAVTIVGWDDNYSKANFKNTPEGDGAWICKNSWGDSWGDKGYFYVSYYDTRCVRVGDYDKSTFTLILNDTVHYDKNYQYDVIGITDYLITGKDTIWYENIFNATDNEFLTAFSTYFNATTNWTAQIYVNNDLKAVKNGTSVAGYYTFNLDTPIPLNVGDTFRIVIKISTDKYASFPVSEKVRSNRVLYKEGVSFFSYDGENWTDLYDFEYVSTEFQHSYSSQVACIKAFTSFISNTTIDISSDMDLIPVNSEVNLTAVVKDQYGNRVNTGEVNFTIGSESYTVPIIYYVATLTTKFNSSGIYTVNAEYLGDTLYYNSSASKNFNVNYTNVNLSLIISDVYYGDNILINNTLISNGEKIDDYINVLVNNKTYILKSNTLTSIQEILNPNEYAAYATYYDIANASATFNVFKKPISMTLDIEKIGVDSVNISVILTEPINASVDIYINSQLYPLTTSNGRGNFVLNDLYYGNYSVVAIFTNDFYENASASGNFSIDYIKTNLIADNVTLYYHDGTSFYVSLVDSRDNPLVNEIIFLSINGKTYNRTSDSNGTCSLQLNLNSGTYSINITYKGNGKYLPTNLTRNVFIKPTIVSNDITKIFRNATQFSAKILDNNGNAVKNTVVTMNINGILYNRMTDDEGVAGLDINLPQGTYVLTTCNPVTGENAANTIIVIPSIVENHDLTKYYKNGSGYTVRILSNQGSPLANASVTFNINGVFYKRTTDSDGYASLAINLIPGKYIVTAEYNQCRVSNNIEVLSVLESSDLYMKYKDGSRFKVKVLDGFGNPNPLKVVTFNVNGIFYNRLTDENGFAYLDINLLPGKYIITSSFNGLNAANTITITS